MWYVIINYIYYHSYNSALRESIVHALKLAEVIHTYMCFQEVCNYVTIYVSVRVFFVSLFII